MLESFDGKFARSLERDSANSAFCGMMSIETVTESKTAASKTSRAAVTGSELESSDGKFARSQQRDAVNSAFCGMMSIKAVDDATRITGTLMGSVSPIGSAIKVSELESFDGKFARSQQRDAVNSAFCGMMSIEAVDDATKTTGTLIGSVSPTGSAIKVSELASFDGKFARSQQRDAANRIFCGMYARE